MRTNPFIDVPLDARRIVVQVLSAIVFFGEIFYAIFVGLCQFTFRRGPVTDERLLRYHQRIQHVFCRNISMHPWLSLKISNPHGENFGKGAVIVCNHQSTLDPLCLLPLSPRILMAMNEKVWHTPIVSLVFRYAGFLPLASDMNRRLAYFRKYTSKGYSVVVFAEGLRSKDCNIRRFHQGPFWIAEQLGLDLLPVFIHGPGHLMPVGVNYANIGGLSVEIGKRITPSDSTYGLTAKERTRAMHRYFVERYDEICRREETATYFHHCLIGLFSRIGMKRAVRGELDANADYATLVDVPDGSTLEEVEYSDRSGVLSLLYAMVHPEQTVTPHNDEAIENLRHLYRKCHNLPTNLIFRS